MGQRPGDDPQRLQRNVLWAMEQGMGPRDLVPMLERVAACAEPDSEAARFARRELAELLVESDPWRAALLASQLVRSDEDERGWAILGLAHTVLGNYRCARKAYSRALALAPGCGSYAHNLGHLLDAVFNRPDQALRLLAMAHRSHPEEAEIAASYAHALFRTGDADTAHALLSRALGSSGAAEATLERWSRRHGI